MTPPRKAYIQAAKDHYLEDPDDIGIDDDARLSRLDTGGAWVSAWVYVHEEEADAIAGGEADPAPPSCPECGSTDVVSDATARWSADAGAWVLSGLHDCETCQSCGAERDFLTARGPK